MKLRHDRILVLLFIMILLFLLAIFIAVTINKTTLATTASSSPPQPPSVISDSLNWREPSGISFLGGRDTFHDIYAPPVKQFSGRFVSPIATQPVTETSFQQIGILTSSNTAAGAAGPLILPLFGRQVNARRDNFQYYTLSNTGSVNSKLPVRVKGKTCMGEYGCPEIFSGDSVVVDGYDKSFVANVYESNMFAYSQY